MLITNDLDCNAAMSEFAARFRQHRVSARITQKDLLILLMGENCLKEQENQIRHY